MALRRAPIARMSIEVQGEAALRRKLKDPEKELLGEPWRRGMEALGEVAQNALAAEGPIGPSGRTVSMLYHRVQVKPLPLWVRIGTRAKQNGYPYPRRVNYDPRGSRRGWWERGLQRAKGLVQPILNRVAREIEQKWR